MYYKAKILAKNIKKKYFKWKEKRNSCKLIVTTNEMNNTLLIKGEGYYVDQRALKQFSLILFYFWFFYGL